MINEYPYTPEECYMQLHADKYGDLIYPGDTILYAIKINGNIRQIRYEVYAFDDSLRAKINDSRFSHEVANDLRLKVIDSKLLTRLYQ